METVSAGKKKKNDWKLIMQPSRSNADLYVVQFSAHATPDQGN